MQTPVVFIERAFLEKLATSLTTEISSNTNWVLLDFFTFLKNGITEYDLVFDLESEEEFSMFMNENPLFDIISGKFKSLFLHMDFKALLSANPDEFYEVRSPFTLVFVDWDSTTCNQFENKTGFLFFNLEKLIKNWLEYSYYGKEREKYISSKYLDKFTTFKGWEKVSFSKQPFHSIFLLDLYLFKNETTINDNFPLLLLSLLSDEIYQDVHFLTFSGDTQFLNEEVCYHCRESFVKELKKEGVAKSEARKKFKELNLNILRTHENNSLRKSVKSIHDRFLLTNNIFVYSPGGFDIIGKKGKKNTFIRFDFIFYKDVFLRASGYIDNIKEFMKDLINENNCYPPEQMDRIKNHPFLKSKVMYLPD